MSESGHSQPGLYERRRRWNREKELGHQSLSGPGRERDYVPWDRDRDRDRREPMDEPVGTMMQKTPIILAKPPAERSKVAPASAPGPAPAATPPMEKPIVLMKSREEGKGPAGTTEVSAQPPAAVAKVEKEGQRPTQPVYQIQNRGMGSAASSGVMDPVVGQAKLLAPEKMKHSIKLVDDQMNWCDSAIEYLLDQTDVLVVGVLGLQGTGKSMVMSLLSANQPEEDQRTYVFRTQSQEIKERGGNQTSGIDFFITQERIIFLDTQPILSPSILDHLINNDRKLPPEYNLPHTYVEMQSLQIAAFLFTVCHVVIVVQDWFTDLSLYRFLQTAEMVKPSTPSPSHESSSSSGSDEGTEYYPHVVFLQNKAKRENFCPRNLKQMHLVIDKIMMHSHLKYKGTLSMLECNIFPGLPQSYLDTEVNLFLLPFMDSETDDVLPRATPGSGPLFSLLPGYKGHPSFQSLIAKLRSQMMSMSRPQLSHTILTEKNWNMAEDENEYQWESTPDSSSRVNTFRLLVILLIALVLWLTVAKLKDSSIDAEKAIAMVMETLMPSWKPLTEWNLEKHLIQLAKDRPLLQACFTVAINGFRKEPVIVQQNARLLIQCEGLTMEFRTGKGHCEISVLALNEKIQYIVKELTAETYHARMLVREEPWSTNALLRVKRTLETWRILSETFRKCLQLTLEMFPREPWCIQNNAYMLVDCGGHMVKFVSGNKENFVYVYSDTEGVHYKVIPYGTWNQIVRFFHRAHNPLSE